MELDVTFIELKTDQDWIRAFPVMQEFRPSLQLSELLSRRVELQAKGYRLIGLERGDEIVAFAGIQILPHLSRSQELRVSDFATKGRLRSMGLGAQLMAHIETIARASHCSRILLYSQLSKERAHAFYERQGFVRYGVEFAKGV